MQKSDGSRGPGPGISGSQPTGALLPLTSTLLAAPKSGPGIFWDRVDLSTGKAESQKPELGDSLGQASGSNDIVSAQLCHFHVICDPSFVFQHHEMMDTKYITQADISQGSIRDRCDDLLSPALQSRL